IDDFLAGERTRPHLESPASASAGVEVPPIGEHEQRPTFPSTQSTCLHQRAGPRDCSPLRLLFLLEVLNLLGYGFYRGPVRSGRGRNQADQTKRHTKQAESTPHLFLLPQGNPPPLRVRRGRQLFASDATAGR